MKWRDGPTTDEMIHITNQLADKAPALKTITLGYDRNPSELGKAIALLRYIDTHQNEAALINDNTGNWAIHHISYPERSDEIWLRRAATLLTVTTLFYERARHESWDFTLHWLDSIATADAAHITSLDRHRVKPRKHPRPERRKANHHRPASTGDPPAAPTAPSRGGAT